MAVDGSDICGSKHGGVEVGIAPELDGLHCFETLARVSMAVKPAYPKPSLHTMVARYAPEFDGLDCFETLVKVRGSVKSVWKKGAASPETRRAKSGSEFDGRCQDKMKTAPEFLTARFAPEFDGLHCFETLLRH